MYDEESIIEFVKVTAAAASEEVRTVTLQARGVGPEGDDEASEAFDSVEFVQPAGLMAVPMTTADTEAVIVRRGDEAVALVVIDKGRAAQDVESGETRLYGCGASNQTAVIRIRANGAIEITTASNQPLNLTANGTGDIVLNGGTLKVARETDPVVVGVLSGATGAGPVTFTFQALDADGVPVGAPVVDATVTLEGFISTTGGAARVKA